ncbi:MAG: threonine dehydratase [Reyranella sp.]|uniref:threonine dehydratase n=1 Tax=Reyranella sp. TaxID=1929291 RepID=UPI0027308B8B|nr:threonine dehydratase [Reyranella sp.]MDP1966009.1 threonine dehydratase [Reyranella sp.]MDP2373512.1 threonine dehydratase [Reyranella sp.]
MLSLQDVEDAAAIVYAAMPPTPQYAWPLLARRAGCEVWVKHENHTPTGAFKVRGGLVYMDRLKRDQPAVAGVISATRGNHGQSIALAAAKVGIAATIVVPEGNSVEKNAAMRAFGAELVEAGHDFDSARETAMRLAGERGLSMVPSFHRDLVCGVATYALELFRAAPPLDTVYVPIGLGSGICGVIAVRDALGLSTKVVGVVSTEAPAYALSFAAGKVVATNSANTMADGMAVRGPDAEALKVILKGADRIVKVSDAEIALAMRAYYEDTHQLTEGAGAASLAALMQERAQMAGKRVGLVLSGGNIDRPLYLRALAGN